MWARVQCPGDRARGQGGGSRRGEGCPLDLGNDLGFSCDRRKRDEGLMRLVRMVTGGKCGSTGWRGRGGCLGWSSQTSTSARVQTTRQRHLSWRYSLTTQHLPSACLLPGLEPSLSHELMGHPHPKRQVPLTNGKLSLKMK